LISLTKRDLTNVYIIVSSILALYFWEISNVLRLDSFILNQISKFSIILLVFLNFKIAYIKTKNNLLLFILLFIFSFQEILFFLKNQNELINSRHLQSIILFLSLAISIKIYNKKIYLFIEKSLIYFLILFFLIFLLNFFFTENFNIIKSKTACSFILFKFKFLFTENSHIAYLLPSITFYFLFLLNKNFNIKNISGFIFSLFLSFLYISLTMIVSILVAFLVSILLINLKKNKLYIFSSVFIVFIFLFIFFNSSNCKTRITSLKAPTEKFILNENNNSEDLFLGAEQLTSKLYFDSFKTTYYSFKNQLYGYGINNFQIPHLKFLTRKNDRDLNMWTGRSNLFKIITELGMFSLLFFYILAKIFFTRDVNIKKKILLFPIVLTQFISGSGYFSGFFLISIFLLYYSAKEKNFFKIKN